MGTVDSMPELVSMAQKEEELVSEARWNATLFCDRIHKSRAAIFEYVHTSDISLLSMPFAVQKHFCLM